MFNEWNMYIKFKFNITQPASTCSKSTMETNEQCCLLKVNNLDQINVDDGFLISLLLKVWTDFMHCSDASIVHFK